MTHLLIKAQSSLGFNKTALNPICKNYSLPNYNFYKDTACNLLTGNRFFLSITHFRYLLLVLFCSFLTVFNVSGQASLDLSKTVSTTTCVPDQIVNFYILYSCSSLTDPCSGGVVLDPLPLEFTYVSALGSIHTGTPTYNAATHTVTFPFLPSIPAGSTGQLKVVVKAKTGLTPGTNAITNCGNSSLTNSPDCPFQLCGYLYYCAACDESVDNHESQKNTKRHSLYRQKCHV
jgi:Domain of unknown function DUF11